MNISFANKRLAIICLVGFIINFIAYYPGFMSPDSLIQYEQSLTHHFTDWHPPTMAFFWSLLDHIYQGPQLMLVFQLMLYWTACYYLSTSVQKKGWQIFTILLFFIAPFFQNFAGYIVKDIQMALSWLLAVAILLRCLIAKKQITGTETFLSAVLLLYGAWLRHNSPPGLLPLSFLWSVVVFAGRSKRIKFSAALLLFLGVIIGQRLFIEVLNPEKKHQEYTMYMRDLTGIFVKTSADVFPREMYSNPNFDTGYLRAKYHPGDFDHIWWNADGKTIAPPASLNNQLRTNWINAIKKYPAVYFQNRFDALWYILRVKERSEFFSFFPWIHFNKYGLHTYENTFFFKLCVSPVEKQKDAPYMRPWFWALLNLLLFCLVPIVKNDRFRIPFIALLVSSFLYWIPYFFLLTTDTDFRYFYWNCIAQSLAIFILIAYRIKRKQESLS